MLILEIMLATAALTMPSPLGFSPAVQSHGGHGGHGGHGRQSGPAPSEPFRPKVRASNTICPVMGEPVEAGRDREVVLQEGYYLVCCDGCGPEMAEHKEKYLDKDGRPKNAPKDSDKPKPQEPDAPAQQDHSGHQH